MCIFRSEFDALSQLEFVSRKSIFSNVSFQGPVLAWLNVLEAYKKLGREIPVNLKVFSAI